MFVIAVRATFIDTHDFKDAKKKHLAYSTAVVLNLWADL